jgi:hypothetical protein
LSQLEFLSTCINLASIPVFLYAVAIICESSYSIFHQIVRIFHQIHLIAEASTAKIVNEVHRIMTLKGGASRSPKVQALKSGNLEPAIRTGENGVTLLPQPGDDPLDPLVSILLILLVL